MREIEYGLIGFNALNPNASGREETQLAPAPERPIVIYPLENACGSRANHWQEADAYENEDSSEAATEADSSTDECESSSTSSGNGSGDFENEIDGPAAASVVHRQSFLPHELARDSWTPLRREDNLHVLVPDPEDYESLSVLDIVRRMPQNPLSFQELVPGESNTNRRMQR